jgi:hypothetical protein
MVEKLDLTRFSVVNHKMGKNGIGAKPIRVNWCRNRRNYLKFKINKGVEKQQNQSLYLFSSVVK